MSLGLRFLIIDGYARGSREQFASFGVRLASAQYREMTLTYVPDAEIDLWFPSDPGSPDIDDAAMGEYDAVLWTGCNKTVYHDHDPDVMRMREACRRAFAVGVPQFGSCWALQIAALVAGGEVAASPKGREMGVARKIRLTEAGVAHPMFAGKRPVYDHFVSHDDEVTRLPEGGVLLAGNDWSEVQAAAIDYLAGSFWSVQYHPEYNLHDIGRLIQAREPRLVKQGVFRGHDDLMAYAGMCEALYHDRTRTDLRWRMGVDDDLLEPRDRQREFINWLDHEVRPRAR